MKLKKTLAVTFTAALALAGGASGAYAADKAITNETQVLSCLNLELLNLPLLSGDNNNIDCSENYEEHTHIKKVTQVEKETKVIVAPEQHQGQGQGQKQEGAQGQGQEQEMEKNHHEKKHEKKKD
ncbi:MAG TPA: hypothetical protein VFY14_00710 [Streptomyces sp.]|nr:hypothetical protein [Streptomyces sp.]